MSTGSSHTAGSSSESWLRQIHVIANWLAIRCFAEMSEETNTSAAAAKPKVEEEDSESSDDEKNESDAVKQVHSMEELKQKLGENQFVRIACY